MAKEAKKKEEMAEEEVLEEETGGETSQENAEKKTDQEPANEKPEEPEEDSETRYLRLMADFQNYKKRVAKEKSDVHAYANEKIMTELLVVLDNFERALEHETEAKGYKTGMEMIFKQFFEVLGKSGLEEISALGEVFDPNYHNAVMNEETDEYESGIVSGVMQKGYILNGRVLRPSMVRVAN